jgi:hypothetical protein
MPVGQRMPTLNMSRVLRNLGYRTGQSRKLTYYRYPIYGRDNYGVETTDVKINEILIPDVQAYVRTQTTKNFTLIKGGGNVVGAAHIYLPRLETLKNYPNFDQDNNIFFNEVEGWDVLYDVDRIVYPVITSGTSDWYAGTLSGATFSSDGERLAVDLGGLGANYSGTVFHSGSNNVLEANRLKFQIKASGVVGFPSFKVTTSGTSSDFDITYTIDDLKLPTDDYLSIDVPFVSGVTADNSSIYMSGTRYPVTVTSGSKYAWTYSGANDYYLNNLRLLTLDVSGNSVSDAIEIKNVNFYKEIEWSVHAVKDYTDEYMCLQCVRTVGKRQSIRRAYG